MILVDVNLLIYAYISTFPEHERSRDWLSQQLSGVTRVALPWASLLGFLRIVTLPGALQRPAPIAHAWHQVLTWLEAGPVWIPQPGNRHAEILGQLFALPDIRGRLVPDAHLAALAIEHDLTLCTADAGFARFPDLRWMNPLTA